MFVADFSAPVDHVPVTSVRRLRHYTRGYPAWCFAHAACRRSGAGGHAGKCPPRTGGTELEQTTHGLSGSMVGTPVSGPGAHRAFKRTASFDASAVSVR